MTRLAELLVAGHPGRALAARLELERLTAADDSSRSAGRAADGAGRASPCEQTQAIPRDPGVRRGAGARSARPEPEPEPEPEPRADAGPMPRNP